MRHLVPLLVLAAFWLGTTPPAAAQQVGGLPLSLELSGNLGVPAGDFADPAAGIEAETGFGFGAGASLRLTPFLDVYGLYRYTDFGCAECTLVELDDSALDTGFEGGARVSLAALGLAPLGLEPWVGAGVLFNQLTLSADNGEDFSSESSAGFGVGAGVELPVGRRLSLRPGLHYRSYTATFEFETTGLPARDVEVTQLGFDVGLVVHF